MNRRIFLKSLLPIPLLFLHLPENVVCEEIHEEPEPKQRHGLSVYLVRPDGTRELLDFEPISITGPFNAGGRNG